MKKKFRNVFRKSSILSHIVSVLIFVFMPFLGTTKQHLNEAVEKFRPNIKLNITNKIKLDMIYSRLYYLTTFAQYFIFEFYNKDDAERKTYVGEFEKKLLTYNLHNSSDAWKYFKDKYNGYLKFKEFYGREIIKIESASDKEKFADFASRHKAFMIKAIDKAEGEDIFKIDLNGTDTTESAFSKAVSLVPCVVEEYIIQDAGMGRFHPESVNTIRYATYRKDDGLVRMWALLRMGCGGSHVDNAGSGGICASVNIDTGVIKTVGYREDGTEYACHPDTGEKIIGTTIPKWDECSRLVEKLANVVPEQRYVGWDLALTENGWCMIEGNDRAMFTAIQMCEKHGVRDIINRTFLSKS